MELEYIFVELESLIRKQQKKFFNFINSDVIYEDNEFFLLMSFVVISFFEVNALNGR